MNNRQTDANTGLGEFKRRARQTGRFVTWWLLRGAVKPVLGVIVAKALQQSVKGRAMAPWLVLALVGLW
jgi:hypothetical protein